MRAFLWAAAIMAGLLGCGGGSSSSGSTASGSGGAGGGSNCMVDTSYDPQIDPASFVSAVDNPLFPLAPGTKWTYTAGEETIEVTVTNNKKDILGISCTEVRDTATVMGQVIEDTFDWYAQDSDGAVWYMGEDTKEYVNGMVTTTEGSWEAGVDGAKPGILIPASPMVGMEYRQEYYACHAEDMGGVLALDASATVPFGSYTGCLKTHDFTPLDPAADEEKYYCPGVGLVLTVDVKAQDREELVSMTP